MLAKNMENRRVVGIQDHIRRRGLMLILHTRLGDALAAGYSVQSSVLIDCLLQRFGKLTCLLKADELSRGMASILSIITNLWFRS